MSRKTNIEADIRNENKCTRTIQSILSVTGKKTWAIISIIAIIQILCAIITPAITMQYKKIVDCIGGNIIIKELLFVLCCYIFLEMILEILGNISAYIGQKFHFEIIENCEKWFASTCQSKCVEEFQDARNHDVIYALKNNLSSNIEICILGILSIGSSLISVGIYLWQLFGTNPFLPVLVVIGNVPSIFLLSRREKEYLLEKDVQSKRRKENYFWDILLHRDTTKEIRIFKIRDFFWDKCLKWKTESFESESKLEKQISGISALSNFIRDAFFCICLIIVAYSIIKGKISIGSFAFAYSAIQSLNSSFNGLYSKARSLKTIDLQTEDMAVIESLKVEKEDVVKLHTVESIVLNDVYYKYPNTETYSLKKISVKISQNTSTLVVGTNGSGKSTLLYLLAGVYNPSRGKIYASGIDIQKCIHEYRKFVSMCCIPSTKFPTTLLENIAFENTNSTLDSTLVDGVAQKLDKGFFTPIGQIEKDGVELSGGEWQLVALERTFQQKASRFLLFDEPTANLDPDKKESVMKAIINQKGKAAVVVVSHDIQYAPLFDKIIVVSNGEIVEQGEFDALIDNRKTFSRMFKCVK